MNILFDCITLQNFVGGGGEYTLYFFDKLLRRAKEGQIKLYGVYSSKFGTKFYQKYVNDYDLELIDIEKGKLDAFVKERGITIFFIGIAQMYHQYDLSSVPCKIIAVCHDAREMSLLYDKNYASAARRSLIPVAHPRIKKIKMFLKYFLHYFVENNYEKSIKNKYKGLEKLFQNKNAHIITVSNYSKGNLLYYFDNIANPIRVFTPPHKIIPQNIDGAIENQELDSLIKSKKKYFLLVSCDRALKNAALFVEQWDKFCKTTNYEYYGVLVGDIARVNKQNIIQLPPLSTADLEQAYKNAFSFVFPSVAEGYGYPPMEAMKYGVPAVCSNVTSIPEIYGDSVIYFSPYYKEDLFKALLLLIESHDKYKEKSLKKYKEISKKQEKDAGALEKFILEEVQEEQDALLRIKSKIRSLNPKNKVQISVITPVYNTQEYLSRCLNSIKNQTFKNFEVILVDDGSTDSCPKILDNFAKKDPRFKVFHKDNEGVTKARKYGVEQAKGEYIVWVDSDDFIDQTHLESLYIAIKKEDADVCVCNFTKEDSGGTTKYYETIEDLENPNFSLIEKGTCRGCLWTKISKRELYVQNDLFPPANINCWEDVIISANLYFHSKKTIYTPIFTYHVNDMNKMSITRNKNNYIRNMNDTKNVVKYFESEKKFKDSDLTCLKYKTKYYILLNNFLMQKRIPNDFYNLFSQKNNYRTLSELLRVEHVKFGFRFVEFFLILSDIKIFAVPMHYILATMRNKRK